MRKYRLQAGTGRFKVSMGNIDIKIKKESQYLIKSNKEKLNELIKKSGLNENDIIDIYVSLHIVLEASLNILFRYISLKSIKKGIDEIEISENIDGISFIDKTILFIYNSDFDFQGKEIEATKYHKIIGTLRDFSSIRNLLLHGHSISQILVGSEIKQSKSSKKIKIDELIKQLKKFRFILEGMRFYVDCLNSKTINDKDKEYYKRAFLDDSFLPSLTDKELIK